MAGDPEAKCYLPGVPRATYLPYPFQIIQGDKKIMIVYGFAEANRTIHMDKENPEPPPIDSWMGRSHGRWEGDTLVVDAEGFNGEAWFDRAGNFAGSALKVEERYTPMGRNAILYEATIRGPCCLHPALEDQAAALPASGRERASAGVQVRRIFRRSRLRSSAQGTNEVIRREEGATT